MKIDKPIPQYLAIYTYESFQALTITSLMTCSGIDVSVQQTINNNDNEWVHHVADIGRLVRLMIGGQVINRKITHEGR